MRNIVKLLRLNGGEYENTSRLLSTSLSSYDKLKHAVILGFTTV
ncbi:hypothetical protein QYZ87_04640 [Porphyromonadaceae bacterium W3.11]|nr:hypothetical protein [Porphyromonadaceae bacterium W3.11]